MKNFEQRFWSKVAIGKPNECWEWQAYKNNDGYGQFYLDGKLIAAHRASYILVNDQVVIKNRLVLHSCDNPSCVNPGHLRIGDQKENMIDAAKRGRHPNYILTNEKVKKIRALFKSGVNPQKISAQLGIKYPTIYAVISGRTWSHIPDEPTDNVIQMSLFHSHQDYFDDLDLEDSQPSLPLRMNSDAF
jgi:hypothetical protein